jgi:ribulose kinase
MQVIHVLDLADFLKYNTNNRGRNKLQDTIEQGFSTSSDRGPVNSFFYNTRAQYNWRQGPVPGRGPAVEKHYYIELI